jgi:hypothetical protein
LYPHSSAIAPHSRFAAPTACGLGHKKGETMPEVVIGMFPQGQQAQEVVPMLNNRGYGQRDVETLRGPRA